MKKMQMAAHLRDSLAQVHADLTAEIEMLRETWDERSERWQESDAAGEADAWLGTLEDLADQIAGAEVKPDGDTIEDYLP